VEGGMTTPTDDELLALAKKATQGPWVIIPPTPHEDEEGCFTHPGGIEGSDGDPVCVFGDPSGSGTMFENEANQSYIAAANPAAIIALIERHRAEVEELRQRVGFIESKVDIEDMPDHYAWAVNELTARKAYSKAECATLIAEQRAEAERLTRERDEAQTDRAIANNLARTELQKREGAEAALAAERKRCGELEALLKEANGLLRSTYQIADRNGANTYWEPFRKQLFAALEAQGAALAGKDARENHEATGA